MASNKRASMREGPLAQLFRKTDEDEAHGRARGRGAPPMGAHPEPAAERRVARRPRGPPAQRPSRPTSRRT